MTDTTYEVTGVTVNGQRFKLVYKRLVDASMINLYRGSVWERQPNGQRKLLWRVWN